MQQEMRSTGGENDVGIEENIELILPYLIQLKTELFGGPLWVIVYVLQIYHNYVYRNVPSLNSLVIFSSTN